MAEKEFYSIKEVAQMLEIPAYVLRYWEKEFPMLRPRRNRLGRRFYSKKDVDIARMIKVILYEQGYTIAGARKKLTTITQEPEQLTLPLKETVKIVKEVKEELKKLRNMLD
ncbi:MAG: MerR family transcriptional regulator [candidate division WOR-3 bacterium]